MISFVSISTEVGLMGKVLGRGGFCEVREVNQITLHPGTDDGDPGDIATRAYISGHILRDRDYRYAIKKLSPAVVSDSHRFIQGTVDLAVEASFLAVLNHPNIIKVSYDVTILVVKRNSHLLIYKR